MDSVKYNLGDMVYHKTGPDKAGIIVQIRFFPGGFLYVVQWTAMENGIHYELELTSERGFAFTE